jgi:UDP-N-acetyl-D-glucosamine dehydrogenase
MECNHEFDVAIIGQGYVGFSLVIASVNAGWRVLGVDISESRVASIKAGMNPIAGTFDSELSSALDSGKYLVTKEFKHVQCAKMVIICVPTPLDSEKLPDLGPLDLACSEISKYIKKGTLIVSESTSYPGTLRNRIMPHILSESGMSEGDVFFATAPERVNPGDKIWNQKNTPRVISGINEHASRIAASFYETLCDKVVIVSSPEIAEAAKLLENTFRLVNLALVNEFDRICLAARIDTNEVIEAAKTKPYGFMPFFPGLGVGGHCIPVDPLYLIWWAEQNAIEPKLVLESSRINLSKPETIAYEIKRFLKERELNTEVLIFGVSYKQGIADTRESPSLILKLALERLGIETAWTDELVSNWNGEEPTTTLEKYNVCIVAVPPTPEFLSKILQLDWFILDCTGTLPKHKRVFKI